MWVSSSRPANLITSTLSSDSKVLRSNSGFALSASKRSALKDAASSALKRRIVASALMPAGRLSLLHMPGPHGAQEGDGEQRGDRIEDGDDDENRAPAAGRLLEKRRRRSAQDRADALRDVEKAVVGRGVFRPERVGQRRGKQREDFAPAKEHQAGEHDEQRRPVDE